jgi:YHYH protein/Secretion system C-terminal sorting domain
MLKQYLIASLFAMIAFSASAHDPDAPKASLHRWHLKGNHHLDGSYLMMRNDSVFLEQEHGAILSVPLADFSATDQAALRAKVGQIKQINEAKTELTPIQVPVHHLDTNSYAGLLGLGLLASVAVVGLFLLRSKRKWAYALSLSGAVVMCAFRSEISKTCFGIDPLVIDAAFAPFKPHVATHWDGTWFYVESKGIPTTHAMMSGINKWQQQVPIPQCYLGANAWQIPLNPVLAATPVPVNQQHFLRGAVAIATNGIPIFNPYTNTGVDANLDGQLDQWGGHCGRADDYHYHIAPLFLDTQTVDILPIAFALDGFAIYANHEPDGSDMLPLDTNHGHFEAAGVYHYHGTPEAPYMIGNMVGRVTEDATMQIVPQAKASSVRPAGTPLTGATIVDCLPNATSNGYTLQYTKGGQTYAVDYNWPMSGKYVFNFISPTGTTTETYNGFVQCDVPTATQQVSRQKDAARVFPNPGSGGFSISLDTQNSPADVRSISVYDAGGELVFHKQGFQSELTLGHLPPGVYFLQMQFAEGQWVKKLLVL